MVIKQVIKLHKNSTTNSPPKFVFDENFQVNL